MNYNLFLAGLVDELEKAAKEDGSEPWHPTPEDKKKDTKKEERKEEPEAPANPPVPEGEGEKEASLESAFMSGFFGKLAAEDEDEDDKGNKDAGDGEDKGNEKSPMVRLKEKLKAKKAGKEKDEDEDEDKGEKKEASEMSGLEKAFFAGLLDELQKQAGWRDLGAGRIAKMKARMGAGLKATRAKALTSLKATGKTGTPLYSVGEKRKPGSKFYEQHGGKGFKARTRDPARRAGPKFQERVQAAVQSRAKPAGPSIGQRIGAWGSGIKKKISGAGGAVAGAAKAVGREAAGAKGALAGAARGVAEGASAGRAAAMGKVRTTAAKIPARPVDLTKTQVPEAA